MSIFLTSCALVGFAMFGIDETRAASSASTAEIRGREAGEEVAPSARDERAREKANSTLRELVDDVNDVSLAPFASVVEASDSRWVRRSVPALLAVLVYGFGLGSLARFSRGRGGPLRARSGHA